MLNGRNWWRVDQKITGLNRIGFFGDSMVYGYGCPPDLSLPSLLEHHLNARWGGGFHQVGNWGVPGWNLLESWNAMRAALEAGACDAAVLGVCYNDSYLFESLLRYPNPARISREAQDRFWQDMRPAMEALIADIGRFVLAREAPLAVVWLGWDAGDRPQIDLTAGLCAREGIPFFESAGLFQSVFGDSPAPQVTVSAQDPFHLNGRAHDMLARHLLREFAERLRVSPSRPEEPADREVAGIASIADAMIRAGCGDLVAERWALRTLRARLEAVRLLPSRERRAESAAAIEADIRRWSARRSGSLAGLKEEAKRSGFSIDYRILNKVAEDMNAAGELVTAAEACPETPLDRDLERYAAAVGVVDMDAGGGLRDLAESIEELKRRLNAVPESGREAGIPSAMGRRQEGRSAFAETLAGLESLRSRMSGVCVPAGPRFSEMRLKTAIERLQAATRSLLDETRHLDGDCAEEGPFHTTIDVCVKYPNNDPKQIAYLFVDAVYACPVFRGVRDFIHLECAGREIVYRLQIPLMIKGKLVLRLRANEPCPDGLGIVTRIELFNHSSERTVIQAEPWWKGRQTIYFERDVWIAT